MDVSEAQVKDRLRRFIMCYFDLVPRAGVVSAHRHIAYLEAELSRLRMDWRWAGNRIDELNQTLDRYRRDAWRPALKKALDDVKRLDEGHNHNGQMA